MDAMDRLAGHRMGRAQKMEYAKQKAYAEEGACRNNDKLVMDASKKFREEVNRQLKQAGLL